MKRFFIGGNWKMNGNKELIDKLLYNWSLKKTKNNSNKEVVIFPPFPYFNIIENNKYFKELNFELGSQNCHSEEKGAFTGEISVDILKDLNIPYIIIGHSERRQHMAEADFILVKKINIALSKGLNVVWCCGETLSQKEYGLTFKVIENQLSYLFHILKSLNKSNSQNIIIAYEPVWSIGTGKIPNLEIIEKIHIKIRNIIKDINPEIYDDIRIIYGGSVNIKNCKEIGNLKNVDGFLIGGSSIKEEFIDIINI